MFRWIFGKPVHQDDVADHERRTGIRDPNSYTSYFDHGLSDRSIREREERERRDQDDRARRESEERNRGY
ncbi:MAG: hypothetical protein WCD04_05120 [Terriglobia bacterium]|jgi:hypothetical protein